MNKLPNPSTPLAFLPPALANQFEVSRYVFAATLGAYVWDIALNLGSDYALLFKHQIRFPTIVYFLSRAFTLAFILSTFINQVASVTDCNALTLSLAICSILSQAATAMLFFLRVTAVWHPNKIAYAAFSILWLAVLGAGITAPLGVHQVHIGPTMQCIDTVIPPNTEIIGIVALINDTAIFLAINYRILAHTIAADSLTARLRVCFGGTGLSTLSQVLLESGQLFYLIAVAANVTLLAVSHLIPVTHSMLSVPALALVNAMACLVFRRIKFGLISSNGTTKIPAAGRSSDFHATPNSRSLPLHHLRTDPTATVFSSNTTFPLDVRVQRKIDRFEDGADASHQISKSTTLA